MLFGHNSNVSVAGKTFHVQTEDLGAAHALIDTAVYFHGRVLHRRTNNYTDLLPLNPDREQVLKERVDEQHRTVVDDLRSGRLNLTVPENNVPVASKPAPSAQQASNVLHLELLNPKTWLSGRRVILGIAVRDQSQKAVAGAKVTAEVEGAEQPVEYSTETDSSGQVQLEFDMPRVAGGGVAILIESTKGDAHGHLHLHLRAKPHASRPS